jgi:isopentenyl-diphosphate delta-isomerase
MANNNFSPQLLAREVILVDEQDQQLGKENLVKAHRGEGLLHRASSAFLFRKNNGQLEVLLQQRSPEKILAAEQWANTVCGNVRPGEDYQQCILRRLNEELGVNEVPLTKLLKYRYQAACENGFTENEMDMIFAGWYDGETSPEPTEVFKTRWVNWQALLALIQEGESQQKGLANLQLTDFAPWLVIMLNDQQVLTAINDFLKEKA